MCRSFCGNRCYRERFADLFAGVHSDTARRFCSLCLVKLSGSYSWPRAAEALGLDGQRCQGQANQIVYLLGKADKADVLAERLHAVAAGLENDRGRLDYGSRRRALAGLDTIPQDKWLAICRETTVSGPRKMRSRLYAAAWLWQDLTGGDYRVAPPLFNAGENRREVFRRFRRFDAPRLREPLLRFGEELLIDKGVVAVLPQAAEPADGPGQRRPR